MDLPETSMLNFFNKVLISLVELSPEGNFCSIESLINQCQSVVLGGQRQDYDSLLSHCQFSGLVQIKDVRVRISSLGHKFLSANREKFFEITGSQKQLIAEKIIFRGPWSNHARELFRNFYLNQSTEAYEYSIVETPLTQNLEGVIHFFKYLGVLSQKKHIFQVDRKYSQLVYELTADGKAITEAELEKILMENRKLGAKAENAVVEFERKRLEKLGKMAQAALVKKISTINTAAGYDIESFNGTSDDIFPNRFIEVKATRGKGVRFYWTRNEKAVAKKRGNDYWIYMMREFNENRPQDSLPIMIQNPEQSISTHKCLTMESHTFLIEEIEKVTLEKQTLQEMTWYLLI